MRRIGKTLEYYLGEGKFTCKGDACIAAANKITGEYRIMEINKYIESLETKKKRWWRKRRTADKIIRDGFVTDSVDQALVFVTLARMEKFPTAYVETVSEDFLEDPDSRVLDRRVFVDIYQLHQWVPCDPVHGRVSKKEKTYFSEPDNKRYIEIGRGLDFSEIHVNGIHVDEPEGSIKLKKNRHIIKLIKRMKKTEPITLNP